MVKERHAALALMLLTCMALSACTTWRASTDTPGSVIPAETPDAVRVTTRGGAVATIPDPLLRNDSIVSSRRYQPGVALSDVARFEVKEFSLSRTVALAAVGAVGAAVWTVALTGSGSDGRNPDPDPKLAPAVLPGLAWIGRILLGR